jgi:hypothetical protein
MCQIDSALDEAQVATPKVRAGKIGNLFFDNLCCWGTLMRGLSCPRAGCL